MGRTYTISLAAGYSHNTSLLPGGSSITAATSYDAGTAGAILRKHMGRTYDLFAAYSFNEVGFNEPNTLNCATFGCGSTAQRHTGSIGLEWHPKATRIE